MKTLLILFALSITAFGQSDLIVIKTDAEKKAAAEAEERRIENANKWKPAAVSDDEPPTMWFYQRTRRVRNDVEVWLKVVTPKPIKSPGYPPIIYSMNFTVFHCGTGRRTIEKKNVYDVKGRLVESFDPIKFGEYPRESVNPGSVDETLYAFFCS